MAGAEDRIVRLDRDGEFRVSPDGTGLIELECQHGQFAVTTLTAEQVRAIGEAARARG